MTGFKQELNNKVDETGSVSLNDNRVNLNFAFVINTCEIKTKYIDQRNILYILKMAINRLN